MNFDEFLSLLFNLKPLLRTFSTFHQLAFFLEISEEVKSVFQALKSMKPQMCYDMCYVSVFTRLFNASLSSGSIQHPWKQSIMCPILESLILLFSMTTGLLL